MNFKSAQKVIIPLYLLVVLSLLTEQSLSKIIESELSSHKGAGPLLYVAGVLSFVTSLLFPMLQIWLLSWGLREAQGAKVQFVGQTPKLLEQLVIENMRAWGKVILYSLALLLPGLWKFFELVYTPFVVLFSRQYQAGQVDALQLSQKVFRRAWGRTLGILFVFQIFLPMMMTGLFDSYRSFLTSPLTATLLSGVDTVWLMLLVQNLFTIFKQIQEGDVEYEQPVLSMERSESPR